MRGRERDALRRANLNPNDFIALDVILQLNPNAPVVGADIPMPNGQQVPHVISHWVLAMPTNALSPASKVIDAQGRMPSPIDGLVPEIVGRLVLPKARVRPEALRQLAAEGAIDSEDAQPAPANEAPESGASRIHLLNE